MTEQSGNAVRAKFTVEELRARVRNAALRIDADEGSAFGPGHVRGDHDLNPDMTVSAERTRKLRRAAVLIPVIDRPGGATVMLTRRADHLPAHGGQIAFPGGKVESRDATPVNTALRETLEETGLTDKFVEPLGLLDCYHTSTGFNVVPVLAAVRPGFSLVPDETEVAEIFEVPLEFLMSAGNYQQHAVYWQGGIRRFYAIPYGDYYIWGATAGILRNLYERLYAG